MDEQAEEIKADLRDYYNSPERYTFQDFDINTPDAVALNSTTTIGTNVSKTVIGTTINLTATTVNTLFGSNTFLQATLTVVGRDSGARITIPVTITKTSA